MVFRIIILTAFLAFAGTLQGQGDISGRVVSSGRPVDGVLIGIPALGISAVSSADGTYTLRGVPTGEAVFHVSCLGYKTIRETVYIDAHYHPVDFEMETDLLQLSQVVVSATRSEVPVHEAPVLVSSISDRTFEQTQSVSLSEGLRFSPGLRVENNCSNCGTAQLRINGMEGAYTQVLINSRPVFSALAGVYGLDMIPANMIDRVEVVRGGGSVLYGGNAIAGTVNIITRDPMENSFAAAYNHALTGMTAPDRTFMANGSRVSGDFRKGMSAYGALRQRDPWDANSDGFTEITLLRNATAGVETYYKPGTRSRVSLGAWGMHEYRRGGSELDLLPHQSQLAEELTHLVAGGQAAYEVHSADYRGRLAVYASAQYVSRESYYGAGGRVVPPGEPLTPSDSLALNGYGESSDLSANAGVQGGYRIGENLHLTAGADFTANTVDDAMPGYGRSISQQVATFGAYTQLEYRPLMRLTVLGGGRFDYAAVRGDYGFFSSTLSTNAGIPVWMPRLAFKYDISERWTTRFSYAAGYRAPQAFSEDLHVEMAGGAARFIRLASGLVAEHSHSLSYSMSYSRGEGRVQYQFIAEPFATRLQDAFVIEELEVNEGGIMEMEKRNGPGLTVAGINLEANLAIGQQWLIQGGGTILTGKYKEPLLLWSPEDGGADLTTSSLLRTPSVFGYANTTRRFRNFSATWTAVFTGSMYTPHLLDPETGFSRLVKTPTFFENNLRLAWTTNLGRKASVEWQCGMQNIFNSFQDDFDTGPLRDGSYVYGPMRPRTLFVGVKVTSRQGGAKVP